MGTRIIERLSSLLEASGTWLAFLPLALVLVQFTVVLMVYVFSSGNIQLQESLQYINALMFMGGAGYTAIRDEHVRVDLFYSKFTARKKSWVNLLGSLFLMVPFLVLFWQSSLPYILDSWEILEGSVEASGLQLVYILKSTLLLFALTMTLFAIVDISRCIRTLRKET